MNKLTDYGVPEGNVLGIRYGFRGFYDKEHKPVPLTKRSVDGIQLQGGTILGTSRGGANIKCVINKDSHRSTLCDIKLVLLCSWCVDAGRAC